MAIRPLLIFQKGNVIEKEAFPNALLTLLGTLAYSPPTNCWYRVNEVKNGFGQEWQYAKPDTVPNALRLQALLLTGES